MSGVDNMNYMYSLNATGNSNTTLIVNFDMKTDPNTDLILHPGTRDASRLATPGRSQQLRNYRSKVGNRSSHVNCLVLAAWNLRCQVSGELRIHQSQRSDHARSPASAMFRYSGRANMRCGCGLNPTNWQSWASPSPKSFQRYSGAEHSQPSREGGR